MKPGKRRGDIPNIPSAQKDERSEIRRAVYPPVVGAVLSAPVVLLAIIGEGSWVWQSIINISAVITSLIVAIGGVSVLIAIGLILSVPIVLFLTIPNPTPQIKTELNKSSKASASKIVGSRELSHIKKSA